MSDGVHSYARTRVDDALAAVIDLRAAADELVKVANELYGELITVAIEVRRDPLIVQELVVPAFMVLASSEEEIDGGQGSSAAPDVGASVGLQEQEHISDGAGS